MLFCKQNLKALCYTQKRSPFVSFSQGSSKTLLGNGRCFLLLKNLDETVHNPSSSLSQAWLQCAVLGFIVADWYVWTVGTLGTRWYPFSSSVSPRPPRWLGTYQVFKKYLWYECKLYFGTFKRKSQYLDSTIIIHMYMKKVHVFWLRKFISHTHIHMYTCVSPYIHTYMYIYMYVDIHECTHICSDFCIYVCFLTKELYFLKPPSLSFFFF